MMAQEIEWKYINSLAIGVGIFNLLALLLSSIVPRKYLGDSNDPNKRRTAYLIKLVFHEVAALLSITMYLIHGEQIYLIFIALICLKFIFLYPNFDEYGVLV